MKSILNNSTTQLAKTLTITLLMLCVSFISYAQDGQTITVTVDNVMSTKGKISFALHTADTFMKGPGIMNTESTIEGKTVSVTFKNVKPGEYAIMVLHDENENNRMDYRTNGMPLEHYGVSNNSMSFGPPQFGDAKFKVENEDLTLNIRF